MNKGKDSKTEAAPETRVVQPGTITTTTAPSEPPARLQVIAPEGRVCPKKLSKARITDREPVWVPNDVYYRNLIAEESLLLVATA